MEIYLSFDDGIQTGTKEVLDVLNANNVKATFFLTGIHMKFFYQDYKVLFTDVLQDIFLNHNIGNHSYTHGHDEYQKYYTEGIDRGLKQHLLTVVDDFGENTNIINNYICLVMNKKFSSNKYPLANGQELPLARLPAKNSWRVNLTYNGQRNEFINNQIVKDDLLTHNCSNKLFELGYQIFGWDVEWRMNFDFYLETVKMKEELKLKGEFDINNLGHVHPHYNMYFKENRSKDRIIENWEVVLEKIKALKKDKVIVLMHDRAFRDIKDGVQGKTTIEFLANQTNLHVNQLDFLIKKLLSLNYTFKTLDAY